MEHEAFFATAAQVIPVLAVLAVLENRMFKGNLVRGFTWAVLVLLSIAEVAAFGALWSGNGGTLEGMVVGGVMAFAAILILVAHDPSAPVNRRTRARERRDDDADSAASS